MAERMQQSRVIRLLEPWLEYQNPHVRQKAASWWVSPAAARMQHHSTQASASMRLLLRTAPDGRLLLLSSSCAGCSSRRIGRLIPQHGGLPLLPSGRAERWRHRRADADGRSLAGLPHNIL